MLSIIRCQTEKITGLAAGYRNHYSTPENSHNFPPTFLTFFLVVRKEKKMFNRSEVTAVSF